MLRFGPRAFLFLDDMIASRSRKENDNNLGVSFVGVPLQVSGPVWKVSDILSVDFRARRVRNGS